MPLELTKFKTMKVEVLLPQKIWMVDMAKPVYVGGMLSELGINEKLMKLVKNKQIIPKFPSQIYKTSFGLKEKMVVYTPDKINFYPLKTDFTNKEFNIKPEDYNHRLMKGMLKSHAVTRFKEEKWWKEYAPVVFFSILIVVSSIYMKALHGEVKETLQILAGRAPPQEELTGIAGTIAGGLTKAGTPS